MPFVKGQVANPKGRPKGGFSIDKLYQAIRRQERQEGRQKFLDHVIVQAYRDNKVLIAVLKKIVPDLVQQEGGAAVENILISMLRKRAELSQPQQELVSGPILDVSKDGKPSCVGIDRPKLSEPQSPDDNGRDHLD